MESKTYTVLADARGLGKKAGDTVMLPPTAAKYLVLAGILVEVESKPAAAKSKSGGRKARGR